MVDVHPLLDFCDFHSNSSCGLQDILITDPDMKEKHYHLHFWGGDGGDNQKICFITEGGGVIWKQLMPVCLFKMPCRGPSNGVSLASDLTNQEKRDTSVVSPL